MRGGHRCLVFGELSATNRGKPLMNATERDRELVAGLARVHKNLCVCGPLKRFSTRLHTSSRRREKLVGGSRRLRQSARLPRSRRILPSVRGIVVGSPLRHASARGPARRKLFAKFGYDLDRASPAAFADAAYRIVATLPDEWRAAIKSAHRERCETEIINLDQLLEENSNTNPHIE